MKRGFRLFVLLLTATSLFSCSEKELEVTNRIWFEIKSTSLHIGQSAEMVLSTDMNDPDITWYSSHSGIATVSSEGLVAADSLGSVNIIATTKDGQTASCSVTVSPEIFLNDSELTMSVGEMYEISYYITPDYCTETAVSWSTSEKSVATVKKVAVDDDDDEADPLVGSAIITAVSETGSSTAEDFVEGQTIISVSLGSGSVAECTVTVEAAN